MSGALRTVGLGLAVTLLSGCGSGADEGAGMDADPATAALERQREEVRAATAALLDAAAAELPAAVLHARGSWRGCGSVAVEEFGSFRYQATARLDAGPEARRPYLETLVPLLEAVGFGDAEAGPGPGGGDARRVVATRDGLSASFAEAPSVGDHVLLVVAGACVEVPEGQRDQWLVRDDPAPIR